MSFLSVWLPALALILGLMTLLWLLSVVRRDASIVDPFWGPGFAVLALYYFWRTSGYLPRQLLVVALTLVWGLRLGLFLAWRNAGRGEDFRYQQFRARYGPRRYWWVSFFQVFLLQGVLLWLVSAPLLGAQISPLPDRLGLLDFLGLAVWSVGFLFEAVGDWQLARFKARPANKGQLLTTGLWRFTRHPNYFGDAAVWWGFACLSLAGGRLWPILGSLLMTYLLLRVSGVAMLERSLVRTRPGYESYMKTTSAFFPWIPRGGR